MKIPLDRQCQMCAFEGNMVCGRSGECTMQRPRLIILYITRCLDQPMRRVRRPGGTGQPSRLISRIPHNNTISTYVEVLAFAIKQHIWRLISDIPQAYFRCTNTVRRQ